MKNQKKGPLARPFLLSPLAQLRSGLAIFLCFFAFLAWCVLPLVIVSVLLVVAPEFIDVEAPEFIEAPVEPAVVAAALPAEEPWAIAPPAPPGVPVVPIGVPWVLRWPAPTAGLVAGRGGTPWAKRG